MNKSPEKICCTPFNALSIMKVFSLTLLTIHNSNSTQLNQKTIITTKAFSSLDKKHSPYSLNFINFTLRTQTNDDHCKLNANASRPLVLV